MEEDGSATFEVPSGVPLYFFSREDPDCQAILRTFDPVRALLEVRPRLDMPGAELVAR